jgi:hypothetical protein
MPTYSTRIYSPRWGHEDTYDFDFSREAMTISRAPRTVRCVWIENRDPRWEGEPIEHILNNDSVYPPAILPRLYEHLWLSWRSGDLPESRVDAELQAVTEWLNGITKSKPRSDFWSSYF